MLSFLRDFLIQPAITTALLALAGFVARDWLSARVREGVATEFKKEQERYSAELRWAEGRRQKAAQIADVISAWLSLEYDPNKRDSQAAFIEVEKKYWELALWLDTSTLRKLNQALLHEPGVDYKEALAAVRVELVGDEDEPIRSEEFVHWEIPGRPDSGFGKAGPPG